MATNNCPVSEANHSWWKCGLDVHNGRLMLKRRCVWCGLLKWVKF